jgi:hypothetical protein
MSRLDVVTVATSRDEIEITWDGRQELLGRLRKLDGGKAVVDAFEAVGASFPVKLKSFNDKALLLDVIEAWGVEVGGYPALPAGIFELRNALYDDLYDAT